MTLPRSLVRILSPLLLAVLVTSTARADDKPPKNVIVENTAAQPIPITGTVTVSNTSSLGKVTVTNLPAVQAVSGTVNIGNLPATQPVSGTVTIANLPASQPVSGSVSVANLPAVQAVSGTVNTREGSFGLVGTQTAIPAADSGGIAYAFSSSGSHDIEIWVNVEAVIAKGQVPTAEILANLPSGGVFYYIPLTFVRTDSISGEDIYIGNSTFPIFLPANTGLTLSLTRDNQATGNMQGAYTFSGLNLN